MNHLRFLRYVDEVARCGSIRAAAERLHIAPSAINRRILDIEDELKTPIFERLPRGMRLTSAGEIFIGYIRSRSAELEQVQSKIEELKGLRRGKVSIIASQALSANALPNSIASFQKKHPLALYSVRIGDYLQALQALRNYEADLALVFNLPSDGDMEVLAEFEQRLMAVMHQTHPLAKKERVLLRECINYPLALPSNDIGGRQMLEQYLSRRSIKWHPNIESNSFEFLRNCLYTNNSISFQISIGATTEDKNIVAIPIGDSGFPRGKLVLASLRGRQLPVIAHSFSQHLCIEFGSV